MLRYLGKQRLKLDFIPLSGANQFKVCGLKLMSMHKKKVMDTSINYRWIQLNITNTLAITTFIVTFELRK